jgi:hypothetical protein
MVQVENRFTPELCKAICDSLDSISATVKKEKMKEAALITRGTGKFYSNGLHVETALADPSFPERDFMHMAHGEQDATVWHSHGRLHSRVNMHEGGSPVIRMSVITAINFRALFLCP